MPSVRVTGRGYVLPNRGQQGIPLVTVNTEQVDVEVYRIGDRNLAQTLQGGDFQRQISSYELDTLKERSGARVYTGQLAVATRLNEDVTTAFPIAEAMPKLQPGVYVLAAYADHQEGGRELARQPGHAVVRRLRSRPDRHQRRRRRACLRALAGHRHLGRQRAGPPAGAQQRGAGHDQDRQPRLCALRCRPEARRGRACAGRAGGRDAGRRLRLPRPVDGRLRPDRPRRQGPPGAGAHRRLRLHRPRRLSRRRGGAPDRADARPHRQGVRRAGHGDLLAARRRRAFARCADRPGPRRPHHQPDARQLGHDRHLARQGAHRSRRPARSRRRRSWSRTSCPSGSS